MRAKTFWSVRTRDSSQALDRIVRRLSDLRAAGSVVGGQAVNAYVEPLVSLDRDVAVAMPELDRILPAFTPDFIVERFPHRLNLTAADSDPRVQFQLAPRSTRLADGLEQLLGRPVDLVTPDSVRHPYFVQTIEATRRLIDASDRR